MFSLVFLYFFFSLPVYDVSAAARLPAHDAQHDEEGVLAHQGDQDDHADHGRHAALVGGVAHDRAVAQVCDDKVLADYRAGVHYRREKCAGKKGDRPGKGTNNASSTVIILYAVYGYNWILCQIA